MTKQRRKNEQIIWQNHREGLFVNFFLKSNTSTSRDLDALPIVVVEETANANPEDQDHMEDNVHIDMDEHNVSDHENILNSSETEPTNYFI